MNTMAIEDPSARHHRGGPNGEFVRTRTGILIGSAAKPRMPRPTRDHEVIQSALLDPLTARTLSLRLRIWRAVARWL